MSITDGQWILDMATFRSGIRPAISTGLSVTRAGGAGHNKRQKTLAAQTLKTLADYHQAEQLSHFGSELAVEANQALVTGRRILEIMTQGPTDVYSLMAQQLILDVSINLENGESIDLNSLKSLAKEMTKETITDENYDLIRNDIKSKCLVELKGVPSNSKKAIDDKQLVEANQ